MVMEMGHDMLINTYGDEGGNMTGDGDRCYVGRGVGSGSIVRSTKCVGPMMCVPLLDCANGEIGDHRNFPSKGPLHQIG